MGETEVPDSEVPDSEVAQPEVAGPEVVQPDAQPAKKKKSKVKAKQVAAEALERNRSLRRMLSIAAAVVAVLLAGCIALGLWVWHDEHTLASRTRALQAAQGTESVRAAAVTAARQYVTDFSTYDYRSLDTTFAHTQSELTGSFKTTYAQTSSALKATLVQYHGAAKTTVIGAAAQSVTATQAKVIVLFDQTVTSLNTKNPVVNRNRATVTLDRVSGQWLMSALDLN